MSRAMAIAELVRLYGPTKAAELVRKADADHRDLYPDGCPRQACPICARDEEAGDG